MTLDRIFSVGEVLMLLVIKSVLFPYNLELEAQYMQED